MKAKEKQKATSDFRQIRDKKLGQKLTMSNGKEMPMAQYNALRYVDESKQMLTEDRGSKNLSQVRRYIQQHNPNINPQQLIDSLRHDIPNIRLPRINNTDIYQFALGVTRMYLDGELQDRHIINQLNNTLKYVASNAHINEYDKNLNGLSCNDLIKRFETVITNDIEGEKTRLANNSYTKSDYEIVPINTPKEARKYGKYTSWCVTHDKDAYNSYTANGSGRFYFCLKPGFEELEPVVGKGCPLDEYGLSMIAVSVNMDGSPNTITCRWNHDNGGNDNIMTTEELSNLIGMNFYEVFKPYTREELHAKGVILFDEVQDLLNSGKKPKEIFDYVFGFKDDNARVKLNNKYNFINANGKLLSPNQWFDDAWNFSNGYAIVELTNKYNFINANGKLLSPNQWFDDANSFENGYARVKLNNKYNFINTKVELLFPDQWFEYVGNFENGYARVNLNDRWNLINTNGEIVWNKPVNQWFDFAYPFSDGYAVVELNSKWNFINTNGEFLSPNQWFDDVDSFSEGYARVNLNGRWNLINTNGEIVWNKPVNQWFDEVGNFRDGYVLVKSNGNLYRLRSDGVLCDYNTEPLPNQELNETSKKGKKIYITEEQLNYIKQQSNSTLLFESARDKMLLPYLNILNQRGDTVSLSDLKNYLMKKFVTEANIHALSMRSNYYLAGVARYYFNGDLTSNQKLNIFYPEITDKFIPDICHRLDEIIEYLRNAYIDTKGTQFEQPEDFGTLSIAKLFKKYSTKIDKLKSKYNFTLKSETPNQVSVNYTGGYVADIMYSHEDCKKYNEATTPGAWCITYAQQHYNYYTRHPKCHFIIFAKNGYENIPRQMTNGFPLDAYGTSLIAVRQSDNDGSFVGATTRWNHGGYGGARSINNADNALTYTQLKDIVGISDEEFNQLFVTWKEHATKNNSQDRLMLNKEKLDATRKFKYAEMLFRNGMSLIEMYDNGIISTVGFLYPLGVEALSRARYDKSILRMGTIVGEGDDTTTYYTIMDNGIVQVDKGVLFTDISIPSRINTSYYFEYDKYNNVFALCGSDYKKVIYFYKTHSILNVDGNKYWTRVEDVGNNKALVCCNNKSNNYNETNAIIFDFNTYQPVALPNGSYISEQIYIGGILSKNNRNPLIQCIYDSSAKISFVYNTLTNEFIDILSGIYKMQSLSMNYNIVEFHKTNNEKNSCVYQLYNVSENKFVEINGKTEFQYMNEITTSGYYVPYISVSKSLSEDEKKKLGATYIIPKNIYNYETNEILKLPTGEEVISQHESYYVSKSGHVILEFGNDDKSVGHITSTTWWGKTYVFDATDGKFFINEDGGYSFIWYGGGQVYDKNGQIHELPSTPDGEYWYQQTNNDLYESKNVDAAARNHFKLSAENISDYAHVIDEEINCIKNSIFTKQNRNFPILTRESLDELCSQEDIDNVMSTFEPNEELNPKIWEKDNTLNPRVRMKLLNIADDFIKTLEVNWVKPKDVILTGSICNYGWSKYSDIDLHVLMDYNEVDERTNFVKDYFDAKKQIWNDRHDSLKMYGFPVELYVQDTNEEHTASGIYSLYKDEWLKEPEKDKFLSIDLDKETIENKVKHIVKTIDTIEDICEKETDIHEIETISHKVKNLFDKIKGTRKEALKKAGELSIGNVVYKVLRRLGYLGKLIDLKAKTYDKINTIR